MVLLTRLFSTDFSPNPAKITTHFVYKTRSEPLNQHDQKCSVIDLPMPVGALHLGDLGFFKLERFNEWNKKGIFWVSRFKLGTNVSTADGQPLDLAAYLAANGGHARLPIRLGKNKPVTCMLYAAPIPAEALEKRMARLKEEARLDQRPISNQKKTFAPYTIYVTNIEDLTFDQVHILARTRWQIELLFKLWKSHIGVLKSRSANPTRCLIEGYAKLIGALIQHWVLLACGWTLDAVAPIDGLRIVRKNMNLFMQAFRKPQLWVYFFDAVRTALADAPPRQKRRKNPSAWHLWQIFDA